MLGLTLTFDFINILTKVAYNGFMPAQPHLHGQDALPQLDNLISRTSLANKVNTQNYARDIKASRVPI